MRDSNAAWTRMLAATGYLRHYEAGTDSDSGISRNDHRADGDLFWELVDELQGHDRRVVEGTIMGGPCVRVDNEFLALVDFKGSGLVVKLPRQRVDDLVARGIGQPFAPSGRVFKEWVSIPARDRTLWRALLVEGIEFVSP